MRCHSGTAGHEGWGNWEDWENWEDWAMSRRSRCGDEASCFVRTRTLGRAEGPGMGKGIHAGMGRCSQELCDGTDGEKREFKSVSGPGTLH